MLQRQPSLRRPIMKPRQIVVKGALRASLRDRPFGLPLDHESCEDSSGAYRKDGPGPSVSLSVEYQKLTRQEFGIPAAAATRPEISC
jgi:hypothetical protein